MVRTQFSGGLFGGEVPAWGEGVQANINSVRRWGHVVQVARE